MIKNYSEKNTIKIEKIKPYDIKNIIEISKIIYSSGKNMANKYGLQHWNNSMFKTIIIILICNLKNELFLVFDRNIPIATFQTRAKNDLLILEKLAVLPDNSGKGIGTMCMKEVEVKAVSLGLKKIILEVYDKSECAIKFYMNLGYEIINEKNTLKYRTILMSKEV